MNYTIKQTESFAKWNSALRDLRAKAAILRRIDRAAQGHFGDVKPVGENVSELRIDVGQGYRVYFTIKKWLLLVLLAGGDKSMQQVDIQRAIKLSKEVIVDD